MIDDPVATGGATLSNGEYEEIKESLNSAVHELIFAIAHANNDELDDASTCLVTAQGAIEEVNQKLVAKQNG